MSDTETLFSGLSENIGKDIFYNLIHLASDGIVIVDDDETVLVYNRGAEKIYGYSAAEVIGKSLSQLLPPHIRAHHSDYVRAFAYADDDSKAMNSRNPVQGVRKNGEQFLIEAAISKLRINDEWVFMVIFRDISENQRLLSELQIYRERLEALVDERTRELRNINKELEAFSYSVSHDLRAPLRGIDGFSQALLEDYDEQLDALGKNYLQRIRAASQHMGELIDNMLMLSRVTRHEIKKQPVDVSALALEILGNFAQQEPERQVHVHVQAGLSLVGDKHLIQIMLQNLIGNAWKYTGRNPSAKIELGTKMEEGKQAIYIKDNGAGFDMAYAGKLFVAFQRLHSVEEYKGTGVGLATVYRIIKRHGGDIWAHAQTGHGATFFFTTDL